MHQKNFQKTWILKNLVIFSTQKPVILEKPFLGAFCHQGMFTFLKSTQKDGFFYTRHGPF
jgi:hypothetical protein